MYSTSVSKGPIASFVVKFASLRGVLPNDEAISTELVVLLEIVPPLDGIPPKAVTSSLKNAPRNDTKLCDVEGIGPFD